ncbi:exonuclease domain-containing protein [Paenibacillus alkaliterrae]|uniref:hypothetical protein n=1 Tax=Paenibacillus alkaliterrae TaxID=320909 RepID=UPI0039EF85C3
MEMETEPIRYKRWEDVPEGLLSKTALKEKGLNPGPVRGTIHLRSRNLLVNLYNEQEAIPRKAATPQQIAALDKARTVLNAARTCTSCGHLFSKRLSSGICQFCRHDRWLHEVSEDAERRIRSWVSRSESVVVVDVEATGLDDNDEIVEIAVVGLDGKLLYQSLVKPTIPNLSMRPMFTALLMIW